MFSESGLTRTLYLENIRDIVSDVKDSVAGIPSRIRTSYADFKQNYPTTHDYTMMHSIPMTPAVMIGAGVMLDIVLGPPNGSIEMVKQSGIINYLVALEGGLSVSHLMLYLLERRANRK